MSTSVVTDSGRRQAKELLSSEWEADVIDGAAVHDELQRLQTQRLEQLMPPPVSSEEIGEIGPRPGGMVARANTLNLIAVAQTPEEAVRIKEAISYLGEFNPARALLLVTDPDRASASPMDVRASLMEQPAAKERPPVTFECVTLIAAPSAADRFASIASSLLISELPDFLWWPGSSISGVHFDDLLEISDRVIVDSIAFNDPAASLRTLANVTAQGRGGPRLGDFTWSRLRPWRTLSAQFFDRAELRPSLDYLERIEISYTPGPEGALGPSGLPAALLLTGWLATRLGWQPTAHGLEPGRSGGYRLTLRAPQAESARYGREIVIRMRPLADPEMHHAIGAIELVARGKAPGSFKVQRLSPTSLSTSSETPTVNSVGRMVIVPTPTDHELLGYHLNSFGRNPVFEEALRFIAGILPASGQPTGQFGRLGGR